MLILHQEALPLAFIHNTVNITTFHTYINKKITAHGIMHFRIETGQIFGSSALVENNEHQYKNI